MGEHCDDIRNVNEGDTIDITIGDQTLRLTCESREVQHADPRSGEVRETTMWILESPDHNLAVSITDGLKSSPDDPDFPLHSAVWDMDEEESMGFIDDVSIHGSLEA